MRYNRAFKVLLLGGYGNAGQAIARCLLEEFPDVEITIAGRNLEKAGQTAQTLNDRHAANHPRVGSQRLDATRQDELVEAFSQVDLVINAASTIPYTRNSLEASIRTHTDYIDTQLSSPEKWRILRTHRERIREANVCYVTDGGFHPGIPAILVRYAAEKMDQLYSARVYGGLRIDWGKLAFSRSTVRELIDEFKYFRPLVYENGQWKQQSWRNLPAFDFGPPLDRLTCTPMDLEEMHLLPKRIPSLQNTGFYVSGFNPITDNWVMPLVYLGVKILPAGWSGPLASLFHWSLRFSKPPFGLNLTAVCNGTIDDQPAQFQISLQHEDGYVLTAAPVVAFVHQWLKGRIRRPGLWMQAHIVDPGRFLKDMKRMGIQVEKDLSKTEIAVSP